MERKENIECPVLREIVEIWEELDFEAQQFLLGLVRYLVKLERELSFDMAA